MLEALFFVVVGAALAGFAFWKYRSTSEQVVDKVANTVSTVVNSANTK